jgi:hypothetical protein
VAETLITVSRDEVAYLRKLAAVGLAYWDGKGAEAALVRLLNDDGKGEEPVEFEPEERAYRAANREELEKRNRRDMVQCVALSLARRGSPAAGGLFDVYEELLDPEALERMWKRPDREGAEKANAVKTVSLTLSALNQLRKARPDITFEPSNLDVLIRSDNKTISAKASELKAKFQ